MSKNILLFTILACLSAHSWPAVDGQVGFQVELSMRFFRNSLK